MENNTPVAASIIDTASMYLVPQNTPISQNAAITRQSLQMRSKLLWFLSGRLWERTASLSMSPDEFVLHIWVIVRVAAKAPS